MRWAIVIERSEKGSGRAPPTLRESELWGIRLMRFENFWRKPSRFI